MNAINFYNSQDPKSVFESKKLIKILPQNLVFSASYKKGGRPAGRPAGHVFSICIVSGFARFASLAIKYGVTAHAHNDRSAAGHNFFEIYFVVMLFHPK